MRSDSDMLFIWAIEAGQGQKLNCVHMVSAESTAFDVALIVTAAFFI